MILRFAVIALLGAAGAAGAADVAQPIGRLFFTPAARAQLDLARATRRRAEPPSAGKSAEPPRPQTQIVTYNGIVRRSDGKSILWLNSRAADEKEALSGLPVAGRVRPDGGVTLQVPNGGGTIDLKVGQRAELETGQVMEAPPAPPPAKAAAASDQRDDTAAKDAAKSGPPPASAAPARKGDPAAKAPEAAPPAQVPAR